MTTEYLFKIATEEAEFEQIHALNYRTFVEEIPQHEPSGRQRLVDKFHDENCYIICLVGDQLIGMIALRGKRPFSLDSKLDDLDSYLPPYRSICEVRLLAVEPAYRNGSVFGGLLRESFIQGRRLGYDLAVMSGTVRQLRLYKGLGYIPFGPLVGTEEAQYQPMYWTMVEVRQAVPWLEAAQVNKGDDGDRRNERPLQNSVNLLPGPVAVQPAVMAAFAAPAVSHRLPGFMADFQEAKCLLCRLTGARYVEMLMGSGSLANDAIAAQLSVMDEPGLVLVNGEFGRRLAGQARRAGLDFNVINFEWGRPFAYDAVGKQLRNGRYGWLWLTHCETSTGVLNDLPRLQHLCQQTGTKMIVDAISSIGLTAVDLSDVYLASGVSGKGLGALPGVAMVYYNQAIEPQPEALPSYLDLGMYAAHDGVPFTFSSNLLYGLKAALSQLNVAERVDRIEALSWWCRVILAERGIKVLTAVEDSAPAVLSIILPQTADSYQVGQRLKERGYLVSFASQYLVARNIIQLCLFSPVRREQLWPLIHILEEASGNIQ